MTIDRLSRILVFLASALFAGVAIFIWAAPELAAHTLGLEAIRTSGTAALRANLGGLFAGLSVLCAAAAWTRRRSWCWAAGSVLAAIVVGRLLGWAAGRTVGADVVELAIELAAIGALVGVARGTAEAGAQGSASAWSRRRTIVAGGAGLVVVAAIGALSSPAVSMRVFAAGARQQTAATKTALIQDDALRVAICGSSAPLPSARRAKACVAVFAGGKFYVVDVGPESVETLVLAGVPLSSIGGVLLTHFHSDHIGDLGELNLQTWAGGRPGPLDVYGGPGVERVVEGFSAAYRLDQGYRTAHHSERVMPSATWPMVPHEVTLSGPETPAKDRSALVLDRDGLRITAYEVDHAPITPAYAYRFDYRGRSVLVTGDLKLHRPLVQAARNVDVMVSEAISVTMTRALGAGAGAAGRTNTAAVMHDIEDYHITPEQASSIANEAHARLLVFYHLLPAPDGLIPRRVFAEGIDEARTGDWAIADDGSLYTLPLGSTEIQRGSILD